MVQMCVCLWQVGRQAHHPLVFYLRAWETCQVTIHTVEIVFSVRQLPLEVRSPEIILFPLVYLLIDLGLLHPSNLIF